MEERCIANFEGVEDGCIATVGGVEDGCVATVEVEDLLDGCVQLAGEHAMYLQLWYMYWSHGIFVSFL